MYKPIYTEHKKEKYPYLSVSFKNDPNYILSFFMNVDVINFGKEIMEMLRDVLNDKGSCVECGFDASYIIFDKNKTTIYNNVVDDDEIIIDTSELYSLVFEWLMKLCDFEEGKLKGI